MEKTNSFNVNARFHEGKALVYARNRFYAQIAGFAHVERASSLEVVDAFMSNLSATPLFASGVLSGFMGEILFV